MQIDHSELCRQYRQAKDKAAQIGILADLHVTTPENVRDILEHNGFIVDSIVATATGSTRTRKKWTPETIEEVAKLWADGATADELAQQYQTTISAILGLQHRNKKIFERYLSAAEQHRNEANAHLMPEPPPAAPTEESTEAVPDEKPRTMDESGLRQYRMPPTVASIKLNNVGLLISHARALQQTARDALSEGRSLDCAYALGELSQVLIRAKESSTQS